MSLFKKTLLATALAGSILGFASAAAAKNLVYCSEGSPEGFDVSLYTSGTTIDATAYTMHDRLVEFEKGSTSIIPGLAESWDISEDGLEYTFHLRQGVKFQTTNYFTPTRELTADDVVFSFDRQFNKDNPWHNYMPGVSYQYFESMDMQNLIKEIIKVDDYTVKFVLNRPEAPFLANIAMPFSSIFSKEYADQLEQQGRMNEMNQRPIGTGPYKFLAYQKDAVIRYQKNPDYWRSEQKIDNLIFAITTDPSVRAQKVLAGECHVMSWPSPADMEALQNSPNLNVLSAPGMNVAYLAYNTQQAPFDKVEVRRALNMSVNKEAIINAVFDGAAVTAKNPLPPTMWGYNDAIEPDVYDPETAKQMLVDAGVESLDMKIWAMPVSRPYMPNARRTAEMLQADFAKVGVNAEIISMEWGEYLKSAKEEGRDGAVIMGWTGDNGDPDNFMAVLNSCASIGTNNYAFWCYEPFEELIQKAKITPDQAERTALYEQAQVIFKEQAPWLTIDHSTIFIPMSKKVTGYTIYPDSGNRFFDVDIEE